MSIIDEIENEARANYACAHGMANRMVNGHQIGCQIISAMINRGMATGDTKRATWTIDGRRASRAKCEDIAATGVTMTQDEIIALVAKSLRKSALPSVNGIHQPDRYQASVTIEDMAHTLERAGLIKVWHEFYAQVMPEPDCTETWNDHVTF